MHHDDDVVEQCRVSINVNWPHLAALPDSLVNCRCCSSGVVEIKCPYTGRNLTVNQYFHKNTADLTPLMIIVLKHDHSYYYQVQAQMYVRDVDFCDSARVYNKNTVGNHVMLVAMSCVYKVQFVVLSTLAKNATRIISPSVKSCYLHEMTTLLLGHYAEGDATHYVGLMSQNAEALTNVIRKCTGSVPVDSGSFASSAGDPKLADLKPRSADMQQSATDLGQKADGPKQPCLASFPKTTFGKHNWSFSAIWYAQFPWLNTLWSTMQYFAFHVHIFTPIFDMLNTFSLLLVCETGKNCQISYPSTPDLKLTCSTCRNAETFSQQEGQAQLFRRCRKCTRNRQYIAMICDIVKLLAKLGLPFRGNSEKNGLHQKGIS